MDHFSIDPCLFDDILSFVVLEVGSEILVLLYIEEQNSSRQVLEELLFSLLIRQNHCRLINEINTVNKSKITHSSEARISAVAIRII
jgi:hypothetical protein